MLSKSILNRLCRITRSAWSNPVDLEKVRFVRLVAEAVGDRRLCLEDFELVENLPAHEAVLAIERRVRGGDVVVALGGRGRVVAAT